MQRTILRSCRALMFLVPLMFSTLFLVGDSPSTQNTGGPAVEKRDLTQAEIDNTLRALGIFPNAADSPVTCDITDSTGAITTQVSPSQYAGGPFYWLHYNSNGVVADTVQFITVPTFTGSPLAAQTQSFSPHSNTSIETPFGVPFWGGNLTSGPWMLVVRNSNAQSATCTFTVE